MSRFEQHPGSSSSDGWIDVLGLLPSIVGRRAFVLIVVLLASSSVRAQQHDPALQEQFLEGVARVGRKLENLSFRAKCQSSSEYTGLSETLRARYAERNQEPLKQSREFECGIRGPFALKKYVFASGITAVQARNKTYGFMLRQSREGGGRTLEFLEPLGINPKTDARVEDADTVVRNHVQAAYRPFDKPLYRLLDDPGFRITRVFAVPSDDSNLVRVEYEYVWVDDNGNPYATFTDAYVIVDPQKEWAIRERGAAIQSHFNKSRCVDHAILEIGDEVGGIPVATRVEQTLTFPDDPGTETRQIMETEFTEDEIPEEEFFLSYYDLPEPNFETRVETLVKDTISHDQPWVVYLLAGCGFLAVVYFWRRRAAA